MIELDDNAYNLCERCNQNHKPNKDLLDALEEAEKITSGEIKIKGCRNIDELFNELTR